MYYNITILLLITLFLGGCHNANIDDEYYDDLPSQNLLQNHDFEYTTSYGFSDWISDNATYESVDPYPYSGNYYLAGGTNGASTSYTFQLVYIGSTGTTMTAGGYQSGWNDRDSGKIILKFYNSRGNLIKVVQSPEQSPNYWKRVQIDLSIPVDAVTVEFGFFAKRYDGYSIDAYFDDAYLYIR